MNKSWLLITQKAWLLVLYKAHIIFIHAHGSDFLWMFPVRFSAVLLMSCVKWSPHWLFLISQNLLLWSWHVKGAQEFLNGRTLDNNQTTISPGWEEGQWNIQLHFPLKILFSFLCTFFFNWRIIALQCCGGLCLTSMWISHNHNFIYIYICMYPLPIEPPCPFHPSRSSQHARLGYLCYTAASC